MTLVATVALGSSTYAWFVKNTKVTAESVTVTAKTSYALLISTGEEGDPDDASDWVSLHVMDNDTVDSMAPVSTNGSESLSSGALLFAASNEWSATEGLVTSYKVPESTDFWTEHFQIKASQACQLFLSDDTNFNVAESEEGDLSKVLRLALVVKKKDAAANTAKVFIYEVDDTATTAAGNTTKVEADGLATAIKCTYTGLDEKDAITTGAAVAALTAENIVSEEIDNETVTRIAKLEESLLTSGGTSIVENDDEIVPIYTFTDPEEVVDIVAYIWMEGCNYDCVSANINTLTEATNALTINLGFCAGKEAE